VPLAHLLVTNWGIRSSASGRWGACGLLFARIAHPGFGWTSLTCDRERLRFKLFLDYRIFGFFNSSNNVTLPTACGVGAPPPVLTCAATTARESFFRYPTGKLIRPSFLAGASLSALSPGRSNPAGASPAVRPGHFSGYRLDGVPMTKDWASDQTCVVEIRGGEAVIYPHRPRCRA
jgi:hypothetical protein